MTALKQVRSNTGRKMMVTETELQRLNAINALSDAIANYLDHVRSLGGSMRPLKDAVLMAGDALKQAYPEERADLLLSYDGDAHGYFSHEGDGAAYAERNRRDVQELAAACGFDAQIKNGVSMVFFYDGVTVPGRVWFCHVTPDQTPGILHVMDIRTAGRRLWPVSNVDGILTILREHPEIRAVNCYSSYAPRRPVPVPRLEGGPLLDRSALKTFTSKIGKLWTAPAAAARALEERKRAAVRQ